MGNVVDIKSRKQAGHAKDSKAKVKTYVFDTSALEEFPDVMESIKKGNIVIPSAIFVELDRHKTDERKPRRAKNARAVKRVIDFWTSKGNPSKGIPLNGGDVKFYIYDYIDVVTELASAVDNRVIGTALKFKADHNIEDKDSVVVLSTDDFLRAIARKYQLAADEWPEDYDGQYTTWQNDISQYKAAEPIQYDHSADFNWSFPRISRNWKIIIKGVLLMASSVAGIILAYPAAIMEVIKSIKGYAKYAVPVALGAGLIGGMSLIIGRVVGFLKLRKLQKSFPGIREGESEDDWMFRKMPEAVADEYFRGKQEQRGKVKDGKQNSLTQ